MRRAVAAALVALISVVGSACVFGPTVTCRDVEQVDCHRAVEMARPLLEAYWDEATEVIVHPGACSLNGGACSERQNTFPGVLTVDLMSEQPDAAYVRIDHRATEWAANCMLIVAEANGAHGEPCAED